MGFGSRIDDCRQICKAARAPVNRAIVECAMTRPILLLAVALPLAAQTRFALELPRDEFVESAIDCSRFVPAPTGRHGFVQARGERFVFGDGTPVRFWGAQINLYPKEQMEFAARRLRRQGINIVRLHGLNFLNPRNAESILDYDKDAFDRLDYAIATLGRHGVYVILDTDYPLNVRLGPRDGVKGLEAGGPAPYAHFFNPLVARLKQQRMRDVFTHRNAYTGKRYADDPTLALVEIENEDSMFWYGVDSLKEPFKSELLRLWSEWLARRHGAPAQPAALLPIHSFRAAYFAQHPEAKARAAEQMRFYLELENRFWSESRRVLREAGVRVPISGTNWQGGGFTTRVHMHGQATLDYIDRHGYWDHPQGEGNSKWRVSTCRFHNLPMLKSLATGNDPQEENNVGNLVVAKAWQRVFGLPLTISEWNTCHPNEYSLEGTGLMAAYGSMQGWGGSLQFAYSSVEWLEKVSERSFDLVGNPPQILQFPAAATLWHRGDVREAPVVGEIAYHGDELFDLAPDRMPVAQAAALVGKVGYRFAPLTAKAADLSRYWDEKRLTARSVTGELLWDARRGVVHIDTARTQAAIGFLSAAPLATASVRLETSAKFGAVWVTALDGDRPVGTARRLLVTVVGPVRNTGLEYETTAQASTRHNAPLWRIKTVGTGPVLMDAVEGTLRIRTANAARMQAWALDVNGKRLRAVTLERAKDEVALRLSAEHRAVYYELGEGAAK
jgi:hypothetical protein